MKKLLAAVLLSLGTSVAMAQTGGLPPEQAPAGAPGKFKKPSKAGAPAASADTMSKPVSTKSAARKAKREAKVGDKPIN